MAKVMFWNVARSGRGDAAEQLRDSLAPLASKYSPDAIVLCEMLKIGKVVKAGLAPQGYTYVKPVRDNQALYYSKDSTLRYYVYAPNPGATATLLQTPKTRPMMHLTVGVTCLIATHAPSVTQTSKPQAEQMVGGYDNAVQLVAAKQALGKPVAIFGDMNVNLKSRKRVISLYEGFTQAKSPLQHWIPIGPGCPTQDKGGTLDWALCDPKFNPKVEAINTNGQKTVAFDKLEDDDEYDPMDEGTDKRSDHLPILVSW